MYREHEPSALVYALAFLYQAATDAEFDVETVVELAVVAAMGEDPANPFTARSVDVTIETNLVYDYDRIEEKLDGASRSERRSTWR